MCLESLAVSWGQLESVRVSEVFCIEAVVGWWAFACLTLTCVDFGSFFGRLWCLWLSCRVFVPLVGERICTLGVVVVPW